MENNQSVEKIENVENDVKIIRTYLTHEQIEEILDEFKLPFNGIKIVIDDTNKMIRKLGRSFLETIKIYPEMFKDFKAHLSKKFYSCLMDAETPVGANTSDAIGQQATQALLNTFHNIGTLKSGGPDGINENISISKRKILYSIINMVNCKMSYKDVMDMKKDFIGITIKDLLSETPIPYIVNITNELKNNPSNPQLSQDQVKSILNGKHNWWYNYTNFEGIHDVVQSNNVSRTCLRLKFDSQKLFEYKFLLSELASFISKWKFEIKGSKASSDKKGKHSDITVEVFAVASPTNIGIIDIFIKSYDEMRDYLLMSLIHGDDFKELIVSGINKISNFYAISTNLTRVIRSIEKTSRFDEESGKRGTWIYLNDNRFLGIPYFRVIDMLKSAGLDIEVPFYTNPESYENQFTTIPLEYRSHKSCPELIRSTKLRGYLMGNMTEHEHPYTLMKQYDSNGSYNMVKSLINIEHYKYSKIGNGFEVVLFHAGDYEQQNGMVSNRKFKTKEKLNKYITSKSYRLYQETFKKLFDNYDDSILNYFKTESTENKFIGFEVNDGKDESKSIYVYYSLFQLKYIDYKINVNLDYVNSEFITMSLDSVLMKHFGVPSKVIEYFNVEVSSTFRTPRKYETKRVEVLEKRLFIKGKMFFTDRYDYLTEDNRDELLKTQKLKPLDRLFRFIKQNTTDEEQTYHSAETTGSNLSELIKHNKVAGNKTYCNDFHQTYAALGHECLRNMSCLDMINMINTQGYISVNYMNFVADVITHNGINPMTSEGISCQNRDFLSMATFDNAAKYIMNAASIGESKNVKSTSSSIFLGKRFELGTGSVGIKIDLTKINVITYEEGISEGFLQLTGSDTQSDELYLPDGSEVPISIPSLIINRMKPVKWIIDTFMDKDILYFTQRGNDRIKSTTFKRLSKLEQFDVDDYEDYDLKSITRNIYVRP